MRFHFAIWTVFVAQVWILDFGRPVFSLYLSSGESSLSGLGMSELYRLLSCIITIAVGLCSHVHVYKRHSVRASPVAKIVGIVGISSLQRVY